MSTQPLKPGPQSFGNPDLRAGLSTKLVLLLLCMLIVVSGVAAILWKRATVPSMNLDRSPDPRLSYHGPFKNTSPEAAYADESKCDSCHADIAKTYRRHPMGRSIVSIDSADSPPTDPLHNNPFSAFSASFKTVSDKHGTIHQRTKFDDDGNSVAAQQWRVTHVIGSGSRGFSYLSLQNGFAFQTPVSWYSQRDKWDLSPGFTPAIIAGRAIPPECLYCHANRVHPIDGAVNQYREPVLAEPSIGCQRCHGPGASHANERLSSLHDSTELDPTIVNPHRISPHLRDSICEQCHLEGQTRVPKRDRELYDFRPGMRLSDFWAVFTSAVDGPESTKAVGHVEQMAQSRCYKGGNDESRMGCVSCHDPHKKVPSAERVPYYRERCLNCHEKHPCRIPEADRKQKTAEDSCIFCHMPRFDSSDIPHTASTDHRILRKPATNVATRARIADPDIRLAPFHKMVLEDKEGERDLAVSVVALVRKGTAVSARVTKRALHTLEEAIRLHASDIVAKEARAFALGYLGRNAEALTAFEEVLTPTKEHAWVGAAAVAEADKQWIKAISFWDHAAKLNPWMPDYQQHLAQCHAAVYQWQQAAIHARKWTELDPLSIDAAQALLKALVETSQIDEARIVFARLEKFAPSNWQELKIRYAKRLR